jgi:tetratricopeptide (TPR) repeat protein
MIKGIQSSIDNNNYENLKLLAEIINDEYKNYYLGLAYYHTFEYKKSLYYLEKMENHLPSLLIEAKCLYKTREFKKVTEKCAEYLEKEESGHVWELKGLAQKRLNLLQEAQKSLEKALELEPFLLSAFQELIEMGVEREWPIVLNRYI